MDLYQDKLVITLGMFIATFFFGAIPIKMIACAAGHHLNRLLTWCSCFSGGVFMAACLMDLFPDVREAIDHVLNEIETLYHTKIDYPVAEFIICFGFLLILIVEQFIHEFREKSQRGRTTTTVVPVEVPPPPIVVTNEDENQPLLGNTRNSGTFSPPNHNHEQQGQRGHEHGVDGDMFEHSLLRATILCVALCFHSLFEGLAIGLQDNMAELISIFGAVIMHKAIMAFSLGLNLVQSGMATKYFILSMFIFSAASPLGLLLGIGLTDLKQSIARDIGNGVLQGISGGTFLYITFFEVLPHEFRNPQDRMIKLIFVLVGFSSICGLLFVTH